MNVIVGAGLIVFGVSHHEGLIILAGFLVLLMD